MQVYEKVVQSDDDVVKRADKRPRHEAQPAATASELFRPLGGCYIKVFRITTSKEVQFYKDGYTDVAGRFDYVARSGEDNLLETTVSFAILVLAPNKGAVKLLVLCFFKFLFLFGRSFE